MTTSGPKKPRSRLPTEEELALWNRVTRHDKPLQSEQVAQPAIIPDPVRKNAPSAPRPPLAKINSALIQGDYADMDRNTAQKLRKGQYPIDATLDLHGMNKERAYQALTGFVHAHYRDASRCLLVISGKGTRGREAGHVSLRELLPGWLSHPELRPFILAFDHAQPKHGGSGAFYLLLKRKRER